MLTHYTEDAIQVLLEVFDETKWLYEPNTEAYIKMHLVVDAIQRANLEASRIVSTKDGISIVWEGGFNKDHVAEINCLNNGFVVGLATDFRGAYNGIREDWEKTEKHWWVADLSPISDREFSNSPTLLSTSETMEYIRHFIWANHAV